MVVRTNNTHLAELISIVDGAICDINLVTFVVILVTIVTDRHVT